MSVGEAPPDEPIPPPRPPAAGGEWLLGTELPPYEPLTGRGGLEDLPVALRDVLFGAADARLGTAPDGAGPVRTFALVDAGLAFGLPETLEASGLRHDCLFGGDARDDLADVAPWLVELEADHRFTRSLFATPEETGGLAGTGAALLLRSRATLEEMRAHLRRFTRLRGPDGTWMMMRYWSPPLGGALFRLGNVEGLDAFCGPFFPAEDHPAALVMIAPGPTGTSVLSRRSGTRPPRGTPRVTPVVAAHMRQLKREHSFEDVIEIAGRHVRDEVEVPPDVLAARLREKRDGFYRRGFWQSGHLAALCCWEAMLGPDFIERHDGGEIERLIATSAAAWLAVERIRRHLDGVPQPGVAQGPDDLRA